MGVSVVLYQLVNAAFSVYFIMLTIVIISSWFPELSEFKIIRFIHLYTDPYLNFFRHRIPPLGMLDLSPIVAFIALRVLEAVVKGILFS